MPAKPKVRQKPVSESMNGRPRSRGTELVIITGMSGSGKASVMKAFEDLTWQTPIGPVTMRADHQAVHAGIVGLSKMSPQFGFAIMAQLKEMSVDQIMPPVGIKSADWLKTLK